VNGQRRSVAVYVVGAALLSCGISLAQRLILGVGFGNLPGYALPTLVGAGTGAVIGQAFVQIQRLNQALSRRVSTLEQLLPICAQCKSVRKEGADPDLQGSWVPIERFLAAETETELTHGICPKCTRELYGTH